MIPVEFKFPEPVGIVRAHFEPKDINRLLKHLGWEAARLELVPFCEVIPFKRSA